MSFGIHYSGVIRSEDHLQQMQDEVFDICEARGWRCYPFSGTGMNPEIEFFADILEEDNYNKWVFSNSRGVYFLLDNFLPFSLVFTENGQLFPLESITYEEDVLHEMVENNDLIITTASLTFDSDSYAEILEFLKYIGEKYLKDFHLEDDAGYLKHRNKKKLKKVFDQTSESIATLHEAFEEHPPLGDDETPEELAKRISDILGMEGNFEIIEDPDGPQNVDILSDDFDEESLHSQRFVAVFGKQSDSDDEDIEEDIDAEENDDETE